MSVEFKIGPLNLGELCVPTPELPSKPLCLTLPGGTELCPPMGYQHLGLLEYAREAVGLANTALAPMRPVFEVIEVLALIEQCLSKIPDILGPPPNPKPLIETLIKLAEKMKLVLKLSPPFSAPIMLVQILDMLIANLYGLASELFAVARYVASIETATNQVGHLPEMKDILDCVWKNVDVQMSNLQKMFASINPTIDLLNVIAKLAQIGDPFPLEPFQSDLNKGPRAAGEAIQLLAEKLQAVRVMIPI